MCLLLVCVCVGVCIAARMCLSLCACVCFRQWAFLHVSVCVSVSVYQCASFHVQGILLFFPCGNAFWLMVLGDSAVLYAGNKSYLLHA